MANEVKSSSEVIRALSARGLDTNGLFPIGVRPPLGVYLRQLWSRRHFIWFDSRQRASTQNTKNRLGNLWLLLRPMMDAAFYYVIFGLVLKVDRGVENFPAFLIIGILMFRSTTGAISAGASVLRGSKAMIRAFNFPRAAVPISNVIQNALIAVYTMIVMAVAIIILPEHAMPQLSWLLLVPIFGIQTVLNLGITLFTARIGFHFPDMSNVLGVLSRFLMYGSGVLFPMTHFIKNDTVLAIVSLNPLYRIIDMSRTAMIEGTMPGLDSWLIVLAWAVFLAIGGFIYFWRGEESYGRELS